MAGGASVRAGGLSAAFPIVLLLSASTVMAAPPTKIAEEPIVPGGVVVRVYAHAIATQRGPLGVWTFVSDGLRTVGQKELIFTVKRAAGEKDGDYPTDLLAFYRTVDALARRGHVVDVAGVTQTAPTARGFLGRADFRCIIYTPYQPLEGIPIPGPSLTALIVTCNEADSMQFGLTRVMARLGAAERFYPTTPWADRERAELIGPDGNAGSLLAKTPRARLAGAAVRREKSGRIVLTMGPHDGATVREVFARAREGQPLAFLVTVDPAADACLVWSPGQKEPTAISRPGSTGDRIAANFVGFVPGRERDEVRQVEDGVFLMLTEETWKAVRSALQRGAALSLPKLGDGFEIVWRSTDAEAAPPLPPTPESTGVAVSERQKPTGFAVSNLVLYQPDAILGARVQILALAEYMKRLQAVAAEQLSAAAAPEDLDIVVAVKPRRRARVWFVTERSPVDPVLTALRSKLEAVEPVVVDGGPVVFAIAGTLAGGAGTASRPPNRRPRAPREWGEAASKAGRPLDVDEVVRAAWPDDDGNELAPPSAWKGTRGR